MGRVPTLSGVSSGSLLKERAWLFFFPWYKALPYGTLHRWVGLLCLLVPELTSESDPVGLPVSSPGDVWGWSARTRMRMI